MGDVTHVGLVDPHAEGDGRDEAERFLLEEGVLVGAALGRGHPGVIGQGADTLAVQPLGEVFHLGPRQAVDDAAFAVVAGEERRELLPGVVPLDDRVADIGAVEAGDEHPRLAQSQPLDDVGAGRGICRRRQRDTRHAGKQLGDARQFAVFGTEIVPPLAHAMRLVDGEQRDVDAGQHLRKARCRQPLRRDVEQVELALHQPAADLRRFLRRQRGVQCLGVHAGLPQSLHLVAHQRDQRRDDDADTRPAQRRHLVADRFAGPGREQHHRIAAIGDVADHVFLLAPERSVPEHLP